MQDLKILQYCRDKNAIWAAMLMLEKYNLLLH